MNCGIEKIASRICNSLLIQQYKTKHNIKLLRDVIYYYHSPVLIQAPKSHPINSEYLELKDKISEIIDDLKSEIIHKVFELDLTDYFGDNDNHSDLLSIYFKQFIKLSYNEQLILPIIEQDLAYERGFQYIKLIKNINHDESYDHLILRLTLVDEKI